MPASFLTIPPELLGRIVSFATGESLLDPPTALHSLLLTCRMSHAALCYDSHPTLYSSLFNSKFDMSALRRRLRTEGLGAKDLQRELRRRLTALRCIRNADLDDPYLLEAFRIAYIMMMEDDGSNRNQLIRVDLPNLLHNFLLRRLDAGSADNNGWIHESEINTLAVALFWLISCSSSVTKESIELRSQYLDLLASLTFAAFRYPCFMFPDSRFYPPNGESDVEDAHVPTYTSVHGIYPPVRPTTTDIEYFGEKLRFHLPPIASFAILAYFVRQEMYPVQIPPHLPLDRAEAIARRREGPTKEDMNHFIIYCKTRFNLISNRDLNSEMRSRWHDPDWHRSLQSIAAGPAFLPTSYVPGTISGRWQGSFMDPFRNVYSDLLSNPVAPCPFPRFGRIPLYVTFRELYCRSPSTPVPVVDDSDAFMSAFLPAGCRWVDQEGRVALFDQDRSFYSLYEVFGEGCVDGQETCPGFEGTSPWLDALDIIIIGETDERSGAAWGSYKYIGRIRPSDGLIVLLREPSEPHLAALGRAILRGYVISSQNFVGRWREVSDPARPGPETVFSLCKNLGLFDI